MNLIKNIATVCFFFTFVFAINLLHAQDTPQLNTSKTELPKNLLKVTSRPTGAIVELKGPYNFTGRTPFTVPYPVRGFYKIRASKPGYESVSNELDLVGGQDSEILVRLKAKTRFKAAIRSMVFPGWGQYYRGDKLRGVVLTGLQLGLGAASLLTVNEYNQSQNALDRAARNFQSNMTLENERLVDQRLAEAQDDYDLRNTVLILTGALWAYNLLDSIIFFSSHHTHFEIEANPFGNSASNNSITLSWKIGL